MLFNSYLGLIKKDVAVDFLPHFRHLLREMEFGVWVRNNLRRQARTTSHRVSLKEHKMREKKSCRIYISKSWNSRACSITFPFPKSQFFSPFLIDCGMCFFPQLLYVASELKCHHI